MPLITKILKPERFTAMDLANAILEKLGRKDANEKERLELIDAVVLALGDFVQLGILSCEKEPAPSGKKKERKKKP